MPASPSAPRVRLLVALVAMLGLVGVAQAPTGFAAPAQASPGIPAPAAGTPSNTSPFPVIQRLGKWNGTTFEPVAPGSIQPGRTVFLSHGWSPGYRAKFDELQAASPTLVTAWTPGLVNGQGQSMVGNFDTLARAITTTDPTSSVVMYSWIDLSATTDDPLQARLGEMATEVSGHRFAMAIDEALAPGFVAGGGEVHLIGHSFGANVATTAALALDVPPRQLTLLDSPESPLAQFGGAMNSLRYKLPRLDIGREPGQTFVDNYVSLVGTRYGTYPGLDQVVDVLTLAPGDNPETKHSFAVVWYGKSAADASAGVGFAWSPLTGADDRTVGALYRQPDVDQPLQLTEEQAAPDPAVRTQLLTTTESLTVPGDQARQTGSTLTAGSTPDGSSPATPGSSPGADRPTGIRLGGTGPRTWNLTFATEEESLWLDFDVALDGRPGDSLSIFVDGRQRYQAAARSDGTGAPGSFVVLYDLPPGPHVLTATLSGPTTDLAPDSATTASLSNLRLSSTADIERNLTAEQTDRWLLIVGIVLLIGLVLVVVAVVVLFRRLRRRRVTVADEVPPAS